MPAVLPPVVACPWEGARYEMVGDARSTITVAPLPPPRRWGNPDLALRFHDGRSGRVLWFFGDGGTARLKHLISISDPTVPGWQPPDPDGRRGRPGSDLIVMGYGADLTTANPIADRGFAAPAYLVVPEIANTFRDGADRPPNTLYRLSGCAAR